MFKNYLKIAFRNLWKQRVFSLINVMGLAIVTGVAVIVLSFTTISSQTIKAAMANPVDSIRQE